MNKSWNRFDQLVATPCFTKSARKDPHRRNGRASRALTQLFQKSPNRTLNRSVLNRTLPEDELLIEDASDEENTAPQSKSTPEQEQYTIEPCSAPSLEPKDLTVQSRLDSDIEDVSGDEAPAAAEEGIISESSSSDSDCESIRCKRAKRVGTLDFVRSPPGRCGRRITDDTLLVVSAIPRAVTLERPTAWMKPSSSVASAIKTTPVAKKRSSWIKLDESFKVKSPTSTEKKSPRWKELEKTFQPSPEAEIESLESTPDNAVVVAEAETVPETVGYYYEPSKDGRPMRKRKGCPLSRLQAILFEKVSRQTFWLHERQMGLIIGKRPVKVESIMKIFGRVTISYKEQDRDDPGLQVEHVVYVDPGEKQLKVMGKGSLIEIEHDVEPHKLRRNRMVHLGVCKIRVVN